MATTALCVIHPEELGSDRAPERALYSWLQAVCAPATPSALYALREPANESVAAALADIAWLRVEWIDPPAGEGRAPYLCGMLDLLARAYRRSGVALIATRAALDCALRDPCARSLIEQSALSVTRFERPA